MDDNRSSAAGRVLCRFGLHRWVTRFNDEDGQRYLQCERCRREKDTLSISDFTAT